MYSGGWLIAERLLSRSGDRSYRDGWGSRAWCWCWATGSSCGENTRQWECLFGGWLIAERLLSRSGDRSYRDRVSSGDWSEPRDWREAPACGSGGLAAMGSGNTNHGNTHTPSRPAAFKQDRCVKMELDTPGKNQLYGFMESKTVVSASAAAARSLISSLILRCGKT